MNLTELNLTREELYEKVWTEPITVIAKSYSLRDHDIIGICEKNNIPRPPSGFWSRLKHGYQVDRQPLPASATPNPKTVASPGEQKPKWSVRPAPKLNPEPIQPIQILSPHSLITKTYKAYQSIHPDQTERLRSKGEALSVWVGYRCLDRAMFFMDLLIKELEARGATVIVKMGFSAGHWETLAKINEEMVPFHVEEIIAKKQIPNDSGFRSRNRNHEYLVTGILSLVIDNYLGESRQKSWSDSKTRGLEQRVQEIVEGMVEVAERLKVIRLTDEKRREQIRVEEQNRRNKEAEEKLKKEQIAQIEPCSLSWEKADRIRRFTSALELATVEKFGQIEPDGSMFSFLLLARSHADSIDPIIQTLKVMEREQNI